MSTVQGDVPLVATCARGTERALKHELRALGIERSASGKGAVVFDAPVSAIAEVNVFSRVASRVLWVLARFEADSPEVLTGELAALKFERYLDDARATFAVEAHLRDAPWSHSLYAAQRVKDVVVDRMRARHKPRPEVDVRQPDVRFVLHWEGRQVTFSLDTTGEPLHKRGYRPRDAGPAPMRETLAAALLAIGHADVQRPFVDPCCGSGTLGVEQGLRSLKRYPGARRRFGYERWRFPPSELFEATRRAKERARDEELERPTAPIRVSDIDERQLERARQSLHAAGLTRHVEVTRCDARQVEVGNERPVVVANLPFGERLGREDTRTLEDLYRDLGARIGESTDARAILLSSHPRTEELIGLGPAKRWSLYSGALRTTLHRWDR